MKITLLRRAILATLTLTFGLAPVLADGAMAPAIARIGSLEISDAFVRATLPGAKVGGAYLTITNKGSEADRLVSVASPSAAAAQLHSMSVDGDVMKMRPVEGGVEIPAGKTVALTPSGFHVMFTGITAPFVKGRTVPLALRFEKAGNIDLNLPVESAGATSAMSGMAM